MPMRISSAGGRASITRQTCGRASGEKRPTDKKYYGKNLLARKRTFIYRNTPFTVMGGGVLGSQSLFVGTLNQGPGKGSQLQGELCHEAARLRGDAKGTLADDARKKLQHHMTRIKKGGYTLLERELGSG